jgi:hypothetical protein
MGASDGGRQNKMIAQPASQPASQGASKQGNTIILATTTVAPARPRNFF